jgi:glycosyltransferase involved in cell wall biosynthesis
MNIFGGAEVQLHKYKEHLEKRGFRIKLFDIWNDKIDEFDAIHIFNPRTFPFEARVIAEYAKGKGLKVFVSPIFWFPPPRAYESRFKLFAYKFLAFTWKTLFHETLKNIIDPFRFSYIARLFSLADAIIPNTTEEKVIIQRLFNVESDKIFVIPNGVESIFEEGDPDLFKRTYGLHDDYILFIGRIDLRKNVLRLIKAFVRSGIDTNLVIVGKPGELEYYEKCKKAANSKVVFLPPITHGSEIHRSAYKGARVFALPSYFETPGLAALEAGLAGANIVITRYGGTYEYFRDYAWYIEPTDEKSIEDALVAAYYAPKKSELSKHIKENFTWEQIAIKLEHVYHEILYENT